MSRASSVPAIRLRGVRHNNLKNFDLDLPLGRLIVITGPSGSGKSSLAFDTLYAEGQRRYIETFSPYARQFFDRMDKPRVDHIEGIPPAIAIEQRNTVKTTRSTVGTMTEICDYMKILWPHVAQLHCRQCGQPVSSDPPQQIWEALLARWGPGSPDGRWERGQGPVATGSGMAPPEVLITFDLPLSDKLSLEDSLALIARQGYQRLLVEDAPPAEPEPEGLFLRETARPIARGQLQAASSPPPSLAVRRLDEAAEWLRRLKPGSLTIVQDRLKLAPANRARFVEACEQAYHFGKGRLAIYFVRSVALPAAECPAADRIEPGDEGRVPRVPVGALQFSQRLHCAPCNVEYRAPSPALFSFNHPVGACPTCRGFGRTIIIDYHLAIPDRSKTLAEGAVKPWQTGHGLECQEDLMKFCARRKVPTDVPFKDLPAEVQAWVIEGDPDYGKDSRHEWPQAWYGLKGYFRWLESKAYKMHVRVLLSRYRRYVPCADCGGRRFQPEALLYRLRSVGWGGRPEGATQVRVGEGTTIGGRSSALPAAGPADARSAVAHPPAATTNNEAGLTLADFYALPIRDALALVEQLAAHHQPKPSDPLGLVLGEVRARLGYLVEVGLGYLTLDRPTRSLSGGETERVNLTTCLGTRLVNTLYVLDEPSVGLHPRDTARLVKILQALRDLGNTVVVVEHEAGVIRAADHVVDLGPGHGERGGQVVFQGDVPRLLRAKASLTGAYLSGRRRIEIPPRRPCRGGQVSGLAPGAPEDSARSAHARGRQAAEPLPSRQEICRWLRIEHATRHNLDDLTVEIPLGRLVCVTGVSGSGKTTLLREVLWPALEEKLKSQPAPVRTPDDAEGAEAENGAETDSGPAESATRLTGWEQIARAVLVDQSPLGRTPRSNPAVYLGAFDDIRELFAQTEAARQRGLNASAFSFNSAQGQCERCRGAGFEKVEMQFLSDVFIRCPDCEGRRYRPHILEVKVGLPAWGRRPVAGERKASVRQPAEHGARTLDCHWNIADLLDATVDEAVAFLSALADSKPARRAVASLGLLQEVGLGYLRLGQPINTLSGGESQRLKLAAHLAESNVGQASHPSFAARGAEPAKPSARSTAGLSPAPRGGRGAVGPAPTPSAGAAPAGWATCPTLFLFDEPTTGLHFDDVRVLLQVFQRLVEAGHSVVVIEHNLDVIKCADWIIDLGPEAGDEGGQLVAAGTPEEVAACPLSHTGQALRELDG